MSHPIEGLMNTAMENIKEMVDVNTIVGEAVESPEGTLIIPISKVSFGFAAGGGEYAGGGTKIKAQDDENCKFPFSGGSGGGVCITPMAFLCVGKNEVKLLPVNYNTNFEKLTDFLTRFIDKMSVAFAGDKDNSKDNGKDKCKEKGHETDKDKDKDKD